MQNKFRQVCFWLVMYISFLFSPIVVRYTLLEPIEWEYAIGKAFLAFTGRSKNWMFSLLLQESPWKCDQPIMWSYFSPFFFWFVASLTSAEDRVGLHSCVCTYSFVMFLGSLFPTQDSALEQQALCLLCRGFFPPYSCSPYFCLVGAMELGLSSIAKTRSGTHYSWDPTHGNC